ncbi:MAG TPA: rhodanese-like domain-containing protein [Williamwhitmania sp.]|jgi:rhodanese-related sulfurtransferase|nr:rhodanese-like domain-containing protein [Williamwhitmania sp.]
MESFTTVPSHQQFTIEGVQHISPIAAFKLLEANSALLLDIREPEEMEIICFDISGTINIPISTIADSFTQLPKDKLIIVASNSGTRGAKVANLLLYQGYTQVLNLDGGISQWHKDKLSVLINGTKFSPGGCSCGCSH